jgi:hypothetical protein
MSLVLLLLLRRQSKICCRCSRDASRMLQVLEAALPEQSANVVIKTEGCSAIDYKAAAQMMLRMVQTLKL